MGLEFGVFPVAVNIYLGGYDGPAWNTAPFRHRSGWLMVSEARMVMPFGTWRRPLLAAISDHGEVYPPWIAARLLDMPMSLPRDAECEPPDQLEEVMDGLFWDFLGRMDRENLRFLEEEQERRDARIREFEDRCAAFVTKLWAAIRSLRAERRREGLSAARQIEIDARLKRLLEMPDELASGMRERIAEMRRETEALEEVVLSSLADHGEIEPLFVIHWTARSQRRGMAIQLPVFQEEPYSVEAWRNREQSGMAHGDMDEELTAIRFGVRE